MDYLIELALEELNALVIKKENPERQHELVELINFYRKFAIQ